MKNNSDENNFFDDIHFWWAENGTSIMTRVVVTSQLKCFDEIITRSKAIADRRKLRFSNLEDYFETSETYIPITK